MKEKIVKMLAENKPNSGPGGRKMKRSNSSENILQIREDEQAGAVGPPTQQPKTRHGRPKKLVFNLQIRRDAAS
jgi:hypothetical protein